MEVAAKRNELEVIAVDDSDEDASENIVKIYSEQEMAHNQEPSRLKQVGPHDDTRSAGKRTRHLQLRDRLAILSPLIFEKNTKRIACTPDLPAIKELDETSTSKSKVHCGVITRHRRDKHKNNTNLAVEQDNSASLLLAAAIDSSADEATKNDVLNKLCNLNVEYDLFDMLVEEALQHSQKKDEALSGEAPKDDSVEKNARLKLSLKRNKVEENQTDESDDGDVIDDTPCYVSDRRGKVRNIGEKDTNNMPEEDGELFSMHAANVTYNPNPEIKEEYIVIDDDCTMVGKCFVEKELEGQRTAHNRNTSEPSKAVPQGGNLRAGKATRTDQEQEHSSRVLPRVRRAGVIIHSATHYDLKYRPDSAPTDSPSSLLQLRDTLTDLSPVKFYKGPRKIASSPKLPAVKEDEQEHSSNSLSQTFPRKASLNYHNEFEAQVPKKKTCLSEVVSEHSARVVSRETLDYTDESARNNLIDKSDGVYNLDVDSANLLIVDTLKHGEDKDSVVISGKASQDTDVVENTNVEYNVCDKKVNNKSKIDDPVAGNSDVEVIDDTPYYVYDRKKKSNQIKCINKKYRSINSKTVNKVVPDEIHTFDEEANDEIFSRHVNNNNGNLTISPTLAKKINETSSEESDDECILNEHLVDNRLKDNNFAIEADVVDCLNSVIERVCYELETYYDLTAEEKDQIDLVGLAESIDASCNTTPNMSNTNKDRLKTKEKVTLKFKPSKKMAPSLNIRKRAKNFLNDSNVETKSVLRECTNINSPINIREATSTRKKRKLYSPKDDENANNENLVTKTRAELKQSDVNQTPIATCYRELENVRKSRSVSRTSRASTQSRKNNKKSRYNKSPESSDEDPSFLIRARSISSNKESPSTRSKSERLVKLVKYTEVSYSPLPSSSSEDASTIHNRSKAPKMVRKTKPRSRNTHKKSRAQPVLSPKTKNLNDIFDAIKDNVVNDEKITLVQKRNAKDLSLYNLSSESDDDFKIEKTQVQKRISSSSLESSAAKRQRLINRVHYTKYYSTTSEDEGKKTRKPKTVKQGKPRSRKIKDIPKDILIDEKMRTVQQEALDTSFVKETVETNTIKEPELELEEVPALEAMLPEKLPEDVTEVRERLQIKKTPNKSDLIKIKKENNSSKRCGIVAKTTGTKKGTEPGKEELKENDNASVSPLPGLVVETERTRRPRKDDFTSSLEADLLQKFKTICTDANNLNETGATQQESLNVNDNTNLDHIEDLKAESESVFSGKTIATDGPSPIRGHNESPPTIELLNEHFEHRDVHTEGLSISMSECLNNMRNQIQRKPSTGSETSLVIPNTKSKSIRSNVCAKKKLSEKSSNPGSIAEWNKTNPEVILRKQSSKEIESHLDPVRTPKSRVSRVSSVVLTRMSSEEIEKYVTPKKSSDTATLKIVLEKMSPSEIHKWLPLPDSTYEAYKNTDEKPKKCTRRRTASKSSGVSKNISSGSILGKRNNTKISPVKLSFVEDLSKCEGRETPIRTRSSTRSIKSRAVNMNTEPVKMNSQKTVASVSDVNIIQTSNKEQNVKSSQETINSSNANKRTQKGIQEKAQSSVDRSEIGKSIASVQDWFKRNDVPSSPTAVNLAVKEMTSRVKEALETTLTEIHHNTAERWAAAFMAEQEEISCVEKQMLDVLERHKQLTLSIINVQKMIEALKNNQKDRAYEVIRVDAEKKSQMLRLLQEDIERALNMN